MRAAGSTGGTGAVERTRRRGRRGAAVGAVVLVGVVAGGAGPLPSGAAGAEPAVVEADLAQHGAVTLAGGRVDLVLVPQNHGPSDVDGATVRLDWSVPLAVEQALPGACVRAGRASVLCRTGALTAGGLGERVEVGLVLRGAPAEVTLRIDTPWRGGAQDTNPDNDVHEVLVLDTGDVYRF
ncbi:hypothetical protein ACSMX9_10975 [Streptomyces sp. LE64]|uniref:hypothetical protein n=1 Tax=Streptomyces sp. LE64 TaxID=3448653 RepID=UPI004042B4B5